MSKREELKTFFSNKFLNLKAKGKEINFYTVNPQEKFKNGDFKESKTKTVYRFCTEKELEALQNNNIDNLGQNMLPIKPKPNTHTYNKNEKYLHFFDNKKDALRSIDQLGKKSYLCSFEIESSILNNYKGFGYYYKSDRSHGYDEDLAYEKVKEYAIPIKYFDPKSLRDCTPIENLFKIDQALCEESNNNIIKIENTSKENDFEPN